MVRNKLLIQHWQNLWMNYLILTNSHLVEHPIQMLHMGLVYLFTLHYCPSTTLLTIHNYSLYSPAVVPMMSSALHHIITACCFCHQHFVIIFPLDFWMTHVSFSPCLFAFSIKSEWLIRIKIPWPTLCQFTFF